MNKETILNLAKAVGGTILTVSGVIVASLGVRDLAFEKREIGAVVKEVNDAAEEVEL